MQADKTAVVLVLGDIGRSPRCQYHALSLADHGINVHLVGYYGNAPCEQILNNPLITVHALIPPFSQNVPRKLFLLYAPFKLLFQTLQLLWTLLILLPGFSVLLVQNPPSIPTLLLAKFVCLMKRSYFVIDWHNFGYSLLGLKLRQGHPVVKIAEWYERWFGQSGDFNICVTYAMRDWLQSVWKIKAVTMHDRPPSMFRPTSVPEMHELFSRLDADLPPIFNRKNGSIMTIENSDGSISLRPDRPALVVTATSWTPDEDVEMILKALTILEKKQTKNCPHLLVAVTGKGPMREQFEAQIESLNLNKSTVMTIWLSAGDYARFLGCSMLGISLHTSSSGLDLPMKVVDMFGCALPVCAINFQCINELVVNGVNGRIFEDADSLANSLVDLLSGFPNNNKQYDQLKQGATEFSNHRWQEEWDECVWVHLNTLFAHRNNNASFMFLFLLVCATFQAFILFRYF